MIEQVPETINYILLKKFLALDLAYLKTMGLKQFLSAVCIVALDSSQSFLVSVRSTGVVRRRMGMEGETEGGKVVVVEYQGFPFQLSHIQQFLWG